LEIAEGRPFSEPPDGLSLPPISTTTWGLKPDVVVQDTVGVCRGTRAAGGLHRPEGGGHQGAAESDGDGHEGGCDPAEHGHLSLSLVSVRCGRSSIPRPMTIMSFTPRRWNGAATRVRVVWGPAATGAGTTWSDVLCAYRLLLEESRRERKPPPSEFDRLDEVDELMARRRKADGA
jgi:hypothetical protein